MILNEDEDTSKDFMTCTECKGSFHSAGMKSLGLQLLCATCYNKVVITTPITNKKLKAYNKGLANLIQRIAKLRNESYKFEKGFYRLSNRKAKLLEELSPTPVTYCPSTSQTKLRKPNVVTTITIDEILNRMTPSEREQMILKLTTQG